LRRRFRGVAHAHSKYSFDGRLTLPEFAQFFRDRGVDFVLMSEHVESLTAENARAFIAECAELSDESFLLIPGIEIDALHALFYGVTTVEPWSSNEELAEQLTGGGAMTVVSHPVKIRRGLPPVTQRYAEAVEVWNSRHDGKVTPNTAILAYWRKLRGELGRELAPVCGIDFHGKHDFTPLMFEIACERLEKREILSALRERRFDLVHRGKRVPLDFASGELPLGYRVYSGLYRAAYNFVYSVHRAAGAAGLRLPSSAKAKLRKVF
jgi:hypothetical protein